jgi:hypothetical protein
MAALKRITGGKQTFEPVKVDRVLNWPATSAGQFSTRNDRPDPGRAERSRGVNGLR